MARAAKAAVVAELHGHAGVAHLYPQAVAGGLVSYPMVFTDGGHATYAAGLR
jgi:hypothetical protein